MDTRSWTQTTTYLFSLAIVILTSFLPDALAQTDSKYDLFVWRPSNGTWYALLNPGDACAPPFKSGGTYKGRPFCYQQWGLKGDVPFRKHFGPSQNAHKQLAVWRPSSGTWHFLLAEGGKTACQGANGVPYSKQGMQYQGLSTCSLQWGLPGDVPMAERLVPPNNTTGTYVNPTVFRPNDSTWHVVSPESLDCNKNSMLNEKKAIAGHPYCQRQWGYPGVEPMAFDFNGPKGNTKELVLFDQGHWFILLSSSGACPAPLWPLQFPGYPGSCYLPFGITGDQPVPADYDNDGQTDFAVFRQSTGEWLAVASSGTCPKHMAQTAQTYGWMPVCREQWGSKGDIPLPGKFLPWGPTEGADLVVWRPSTGSWWLKSSHGKCPSVMDDAGTHNGRKICTQQWGLPGDVPIPNTEQIIQPTTEIYLSGLTETFGGPDTVPSLSSSADFNTLKKGSTLSTEFYIFDAQGIAHKLNAYMFRIADAGAKVRYIVQLYAEGADVASSNAKAGTAFGLAQSLLEIMYYGNQTFPAYDTPALHFSIDWANGSPSSNIAFYLSMFENEGSPPSTYMYAGRDGQHGGIEWSY